MNTTPISTESLLAQLRWRYATKKFDPSRKIPADVWATLEESLVLTPSSFGLEPWRFYVIENPEIRQKLVANSWNQTQVVDASHLVVFATKTNLGIADAEALLARIAETRGVTLESLKAFRDLLIGFFDGLPPGFDVDAWSTRQVYIALGNFMTSAALLGIDTCPMEGIDPNAYDQILGLREQGYATAVVCPAGYRAADDRYADYPKVRRALSDTVVHI